MIFPAALAAALAFVSPCTSSDPRTAAVLSAMMEAHAIHAGWAAYEVQHPRFNPVHVGGYAWQMRWVGIYEQTVSLICELQP